MKSENQKYCHECGELINSKAEICIRCGVRQPSINTGNSITDNKWLVTLLLCWFLGPLGVHRFYNGHIAIGVIQLLTMGGCLVWYLVDLIMIVTSNFKDADGNILKTP